MLCNTTVLAWSAHSDNMRILREAAPTPFQANATVLCACEPSPAGGDVYRMANLLLIWIALPCIASVGACFRADSRPLLVRAGIVTNMASITIYTQAPMWQRSSGRYLTVLSASDLCVCVLGETDIGARRVPS